MPGDIPALRPRAASLDLPPRAGTPSTTTIAIAQPAPRDEAPGPPRRANSLPVPRKTTQAIAPRASLDAVARQAASLPAGAREPVDAPDAMATRATLLRDYHQALQRPVSTEHALAAVKLRGAAQVQYGKNELSKLRPSLAKRHAVHSEEFKRLMRMEPDDAIAWLADHPGEGSRTLLADLAEAHLLQSFGIDHEAFRRGIRKAAMWEQLHSVAGRVVSLAGSGVAFGTSFIPEHGVDLAVEHGKKAARFIGHQLPANIVNPGLTGWLRSKTDVIETYRRVGGAPVVAPTLEKSRPMGEVRDRMADATRSLAAATARLRDAEDWQAELPAFVESFLKLDAIADGEYKSRMGFNKLSGYSKAWGGAVNLLASAGTLASISGHPHVGLGIAAAAVPLQWLAGVGDEHTKHDFNHRANTKWALQHVLVDAAKNLPFEELRPEHISQERVRALFSQLPQMQVAGVREVYEDKLGAWLRKATQLEERIERKRAAGAAPGELAALRASLADREARIDALKADVARFESFDEAQWRDIPADSLLGKCLDDTGELSRRQRRARTNRPGEVAAQVLQRYAQAFHNPALAAGIDLPVAEGLAMAGEGLGATMPLGVVSAAAFVAETGEVRADKPRNKAVLGARRVDDARWQADAARWTFEAGGRRVDLRTSGGYNQLVHTRAQRFGRVAAEVPRSLFTAPVGAWRLAGARRQRSEAKAALQDAVQQLADKGLPRRPGSAASAPGSSIAVLRHEFLGFQPVHDLLAPAAPQDA